MFSKFAKCRANYESGQIFPFLIGLLCMVIIMTMITVNLGQIGIFHTDVSNAADAGALAGASILSGGLVKLGTMSDAMFARFWEALLAIIICSSIDWVGVVMIYLGFIYDQYSDVAVAQSEGRMIWFNAKKSAMQYAFSNAGIDEPRPSFKQFLNNAYGVDLNAPGSTDLGPLYGEYVNGASRRAADYATPGFSRFMSDGDEGGRGFWELGKANPEKGAEGVIISGYGWEQQNDGTFINSYDSAAKAYNQFENFTEVTITGSSMYVYTVENWLMQLYKSCVSDFMLEQMKIKGVSAPWSYLAWVWNGVMAVIQWIVDLIIGIITVLFPSSLALMEQPSQTDYNPITVTVKRFKREQDYGLWRFRYGDRVAPITASAQGVAYSTGSSSIGQGVFINVAPFCEILADLFDGQGWQSFEGMLNILESHLFETKLINTN